MKRLLSSFMFVVLLIFSVAVLADDNGKTPPPANPAPTTNDGQYELGAIRILVYEQVKRASEWAEVYINDKFIDKD
jgi:hypothetical protein